MSGHGHVIPNPDGSKARCGGPRLCSVCAFELAEHLWVQPLSGPLKLDTDSQVFFYEQEFYVLSNFSSFRLHWRGLDFDTSEHAYHWTRFQGDDERSAQHRYNVLHARSAHDAFRYAQEHKNEQREGWLDIRVPTMRAIVHAKVEQHEYVRRKLLETGDRELIENSHRDSFWGWGYDRKGLNMLGKLWMEERRELRLHGY